MVIDVSDDDEDEDEGDAVRPATPRNRFTRSTNEKHQHPNQND